MADQDTLMKFRPHASTLDEAMEQCVELEPTMEALRDHLDTIWAGDVVRDADLSAKPYGPDDRIGWMSQHMIQAHWPNGEHGVIGFTDCCPEGSRDPDTVKADLAAYEAEFDRHEENWRNRGPVMYEPHPSLSYHPAGTARAAAQKRRSDAFANYFDSDTPKNKRVEW